MAGSKKKKALASVAAGGGATRVKTSTKETAGAAGVTGGTSLKATALGVGIVKPPPNVTVPTVPAGFVPSNPKDYRGFRPKSSELAVVPDVVIELENFSDYVAVFGKTAPPEANIAQALDASLSWTAMLADSTEWFGYVKSQEGMAWKDTLTLVDKLKGPFALASQHDPSLVSRYPALARLLGAATVI
ncbi:MAG TPA: hypothetical protein VGI39_12800, partial [Polyangiaceae bacterium]